MSPDSLKQEKEMLEQKVREIRAKIIQEIAKGKFFGLDDRVRQVQKQLELLKWI